MLLKILIAGDGGQGVQTVAEVISRAAFLKNFFVSFIPNYCLEQRGGVSLAFIQIGDHDISYPKFSTPDILIVMSDQARERVAGYKRKSVKLIDIKDFQNILIDNDIKNSSQNVFILGILGKILRSKKIILDKEIFSILEKKLSEKVNWEENKKAYLLANK